MSLPETITYDEGIERYFCSKGTLCTAVKAGHITAYRAGSKVRMDKKSADEWYLGKRVKAKARKGRPRKRI